jgi:hypothetical protein
VLRQRVRQSFTSEQAAGKYRELYRTLRETGGRGGVASAGRGGAV